MKSHIRFYLVTDPHQNEKSYLVTDPVLEWKVISSYRSSIRMKSHIRFYPHQNEKSFSVTVPPQNEKSYPVTDPVSWNEKSYPIMDTYLHEKSCKVLSASEWKVLSDYVSGIKMKSHIQLCIQYLNEKSSPITDPHKKDQVLKLANRAPCVCCEIWYNLCFKGTVTWDKYLCHGEGGSFRQQTPFLIVLLQLPPSMFNQFLAIACGSHW